jgi:hypothetical protein
MSETVDDIARRIAKKLFTAGSGEKADRLVLMEERGHGPSETRDLGGWCEKALADFIANDLLALVQRAEAAERVRTACQPLLDICERHSVFPTEREILSAALAPAGTKEAKR